MEVAGLAVGVAALAGLFESAVACFERVQAARTFDSDFDSLTLQLDCTQVRLTRWGAAVGINGSDFSTATIANDGLPEIEVNLAKELLEKIISRFEEAERTSKRYGNHADGAAEGLTETGVELRRYLTSVCDRRRKKTSLVRKARWALHGRENLEKLINELQGLVKDLTELFPGCNAAQEALCDEEVAGVPDAKSLSLLMRLAQQSDPMLKRAISRRESDQAQSTSNTWNNYDGSKVINQIAGDQTVTGGQTFTF